MVLFAGAAVFALASASLFAQVPGVKDVTLTEKDVKTFIEFANSTPEAQAKLMSDSGLDPVNWASALGKISLVVGLRAMGQSADMEKNMLAQNPTFKYSDAELALINANEAELVASYKKMTGQ
jgi:hypothetical protein